jgi:phospholipid/cholesterol/gamma-HCH transport system permease protein
MSSTLPSKDGRDAAPDRHDAHDPSTAPAEVGRDSDAMPARLTEIGKAAAELQDDSAGGSARLMLSGDWRHHGVAGVNDMMLELPGHVRADELIVDMRGVDHIDTAGAWLIRRLQAGMRAAKKGFRVEGADDKQTSLLLAVPEELKREEAKSAPAQTLFERAFTPVGRVMYDVFDDIVAALFILGSAVRGAQMKTRKSTGVSPAAIVSQIDSMGVRAVPIITLMSFLIGAIIAQQGAFQLRYFGAELFVVDLVGILQLREIGVLLTAIMIAGRSGSAITAEIGSMKMREEVDALKVMGLNPVGVLVFPRLVALTIALPLLTIIANFSALAGACAVTWAYSGITPDVFLQRLQEAVDIPTVLAGMIKAPFMALVIGIVASVEGMKVGGSAESLGQRVTASVVKAIFVVILMDGLFAIFYAAIEF